MSHNVRQQQRRPTLKALRRARLDAGLTISELAKRAGVSRDTISHAERGRHSLQAPTLAKIAHVLGRTPSQILAEEERLSPKALSSSLEPPLFNGLEGERRPKTVAGSAHLAATGALFAEGIVGAAAEGWLREVGDPETDSAAAWGLVKAARDLENRLSVFLGGPESQGIQGEALGEIARTMKRLEEVEARYGARLEAELKRHDAPADELAALRRRKEQLDEWKAGKTA